MWGGRGDDEALNGLTRQEWSAAYFLGLERMFRWDGPSTFAAQMREGHLRLIEAGYRAPCCDVATGTLARCSLPPGEHEKSCREILDGSFDPIERAREALFWIENNVPRVNTDWLRALLSAYDDAHRRQPVPSTDARGAPASHRGGREVGTRPL